MLMKARNIFAPNDSINNLAIITVMIITLTQISPENKVVKFEISLNTCV